MTAQLVTVIIICAAYSILSAWTRARSDRRYDAALAHWSAERTDLLNRVMSNDFGQYVAISSEPQPEIVERNIVLDPTGLIDADGDDDASLIP